ncbi:class I SAM-dependent methyltransferase [Nocardioides sp. Root140]|uniref:class I SAM-dependent methyltransferase n=1 Tax=Nocardioides sp. Root140 TaxID=1736460 RepID=UPI0006F8DD86|nr:class I SAM-dependent methyltransferase [Nocardioides sp. Root140]KQY57278.1 hypothetical protein ASD30_13680 [Nocardioides sp. Root140]
MSGHHHDHETPDWDVHYAGAAPVWSGNPNEALVREASDLPAGTALDVGCGEGADAIWLASRGWQVTALDVSGTALDRARAAAESDGAQVAWLHTGLADALTASYDLVISFYPALERADGANVDRLLSLVTPGGTLLVVHHADVDRERALEHGFDPEAYVGHEHLVDAVTDAGWVVEQQGRRARTAPEGPGAHHHTDLVLRARRPG